MTAARKTVSINTKAPAPAKATRTPPRTAAKSGAKPASPATKAGSAEPLKPAKALPVEKMDKAPKADKVEKSDKARKPKLVRDSFTIPKAEYQVLDELKERSARLARPAKKSELLRAGIKALAGMADAALLAALQAVPAIKTGRPKASGNGKTA